MCICRVVKCFAFSVTGFGQICARWRAVVVNYNKSTNCANMPKTVRLKCSTGVGYGYIYQLTDLFEDSLNFIGTLPCFQRNWFRTDLREMARSCSNLQQVDRLCKYDGSSTIKVFWRDWVRVYTYRMRAVWDFHTARTNRRTAPCA